MYRIADDEFRKDAYYGKLWGCQYPDNKRKRVLEHFGEQVTFLLSLNKLSKDVTEFLRVCHEFRNDSYHHSRFHLRTIVTVARTYLTLLCSLYPKLWMGGVTWYPGAPESLGILQKYGLKDAWSVSEETLSRVCQEVVKGRSCSTQDLTQCLASDLTERIDSIVSSLKGMIEEGFAETQGEALRLAQYEAREKPVSEPPKTHDEYLGRLKRLDEERASFRGCFTLTTLSKWRQKAAKIRKASNPSPALRIVTV